MPGARSEEFKQRLRDILAQPDVRARHSEGLRAAAGRIRAGHERGGSWLSRDQIALILPRIGAGEPYHAIARDWLVAPSVICRIAQRHGLARGRNAWRRRE